MMGTPLLILSLILVPSSPGSLAHAEGAPAKPQTGELPDVPDLDDSAWQRVPRPFGATVGGWVRFMRIRHNGEDWDLNLGPDDDRHMLVEFYKRMKIPVARKCEAVTIEKLSKFPRKFSPPFVYITGKQAFSIKRFEAAILRDYLLGRGGFIIGDSPGGDFSKSFKRMVHQVLGRDYKWEDIPDDDEIYRCHYKMAKGAPALWHHDGTRALGIKGDGRWIVFYHAGHMSDAWKKGHSGASKEDAEAAYQLGTNLIHYAFVKYIDFRERADKRSDP